MSIEERLKPFAAIGVAIAAIVISLIVVLKNPLEDPDLGWHLTNGKRIWDRADFPLKDGYSWTSPGYRYADSWWLTEVVVVGLLPVAGFGGLAVLFTAIGVGTLVLLTGPWSYWRQAPGTVAALLLTAALVAGPVIGMRAQTLSFLLFSLLWLGLREAFIAPKRSSLPRWVYLLPPFFVFWANLHAGWVLGLTLLFIAVGIEWLRFLLIRFTGYRGWLTQGSGPRSADPGGSDQPEPRMIEGWRLIKLSLLAMVSAGGTLINPYGIWLHRSIWQDASSALIKNNIIEWLAPNFHHAFGLSVLFFLFLAVSVLVGRGTGELCPLEAAVLLFVTLSALTAVRNTTYLFSVAMPLLIDAFGKARVPKLIFSFPSFQLLFWPLLTVAVARQFLLPNINPYRTPESLMAQVDLPFRSTQYLKVVKPGTRVFNLYGWGGFMIWQLPEFPTFIDGRMPGWGISSKTLSSRGFEASSANDVEATTVFEDYIQIVELKDGFDETISRRGIDWFWLAPDDKLVAWLRIHPGWEKIFEDKTAVVFRQRPPAQA